MLKFRNKPLRNRDGYWHSKKEYLHYLKLKDMERCGEITELRRQVGFAFVVNYVPICEYLADFTFLRNGKRVIQDVKGYKQGMAYRMFRIKKALMQALNSEIIEEV